MNTTNIATRLLAGALITALIGSVSSIASAAEGSDSAQKTIKYTDVSISSAQGADALYNRIRSASQEVCSSLDHGDLSSKAHAKACTQRAIADAVSQVNRPSLTAVYNARNGGSLPMIAAAK